MSYDWKDLYSFSNDLLSSSVGPNSETRYRTIASRSYFCVHNLASKWLTENTSFTKPQQDTHKSVIDEYEKIGQLKAEAGKIGASLELLRVKRVKADTASRIRPAYRLKRRCLVWTCGAGAPEFFFFC
jgi:orotidine-5'-phosphate decarboxylase